MTRARPSVVVLDYGSGNLRSARRALERAGADTSVTADAEAALNADGLVVPGRGRVRRVHAGPARGARRRDHRQAAGPGPAGARDLRGHAGAVQPRAASTASGQPAAASGRAWSTSSTRPCCRIWAGTPCARPRESRCSQGSARTSGSTSCTPTRPAPGPNARAHRQPLLTWAEHGQPFLAAVEDGPLCATQFHPEKSGDAGAALLANWLELIT